MIRTFAALLLALAAFGAACARGGGSTGSDRTSTPSPGDAAAACSPVRPHAPGDSDETIDAGGVARSYILHVPAGYDGTAATPLLLAFHQPGSSSTSFAAYTRLGAAADREGYIVAFPQGAGEPQPPRWNARNVPGDAGDVAFTEALLTQLEGSLCIDSARIYIAGYSGGGGMALRIACDMTERVAAVAAVAATYIPCQADVPLIAFHGTGDVLAPFEGGASPQDGTLPPVRRAVSEWARTAGCDGLPLILRPSEQVELSTFRRCKAGDGEVLLYTVLDGGHTWPGTQPLSAAALGATTQEINATDAMLSFFGDHPPAP